MKPQLIYYKVFTPRHKFVVEKHEVKRLARCMLVETGYNRYIYHYEKMLYF